MKFAFTPSEEAKAVDKFPCINLEIDLIAISTQDLHVQPQALSVIHAEGEDTV